jgi:Glycosyltransferase family 87
VPRTSSARVSTRTLLVLAAGALVLVRIAMAWLLIHDSPSFWHDHAVVGDLLRWRRIARAHGVPYRDVPIEYPPLTWAASQAFGIGSVHTAVTALVWSQLGLDLLVAAGLLYGWGRSSALAYLVIGLTMTVWPFVYMRLDLLPVVLVTWALAGLRRARPTLAGVGLALAAFAKIWPVVLMPLLVARREYRSAVAMAVAGAIGLTAWIAWGGTGAPGEVLTFRHAPGWQIESTIGAIVRAVGTGAVRVEAGAWRVGRVGTVGKVVPGVVLVVLVLAAGWLLSRVPDAGPDLADGVAGLAVVAASLACASIFSPQYAVWLLPFAAIAFTGRRRLPSALAALVCALSTLAMWNYLPVVRGTLGAEVVVFTRNAAVLALVVTSLVVLARAGRRARPARPQA